jgi:predicted dehydrogenase
MQSSKSILIIGAGSIGERHVSCFAKDDRALVSICESREGLRREVADRYHIKNAFAHLDEALSAGCDAAVICTPANSHSAIANACADAGAHLLIEKPLSTNLHGLEELKQKIHDQRLIAGVAYVYRCYPALAALRTSLISGRFGRPLQIAVEAGQHFPFYRPAYRDTYYRDHATGGGAVQDALTHVINAAEWLVGPIDRLVSDADHLHLEGVTVEDTVHVLARHGEVMGSYSLNQHQRPNELSITVNCEGGTLRFATQQPGWRWMTDPQNDWQAEMTPAMDRDRPFEIQATSFLDALNGISPVLCSFEDGLQTLKVNLAILRSAESRTWQTIHQEVAHV